MVLRARVRVSKLPPSRAFNLLPVLRLFSSLTRMMSGRLLVNMMLSSIGDALVFSLVDGKLGHGLACLGANAGWSNMSDILTHAELQCGLV